MAKLYSKKFVHGRASALIIFALLVIFGIGSVTQVLHAADTSCRQSFEVCVQALQVKTSSAFDAIQTPKIPEPQLVVSSVPRKVGDKTVIDYSVRSNGTITADFEEFKRQADETLNSDKGWARLGLLFNQVQSGGAFTLWLSQADLVIDFSPTVCGNDYSCQVGSDVIINQDRWLHATKPWNDAGGSIRDYRHMVINHEVGHWLGHDHANCSSPGAPAPVMRQQSIDLQGCTFNPWPLDSELWTTR